MKKTITQHSIKAMLICLLAFTGIKQTNAQSKYTLSFSGSSQYVSVPSASQVNFGTGNFTLEAWVNYTSSASNYTGIVVKGGTGATWTGYQLVLVGNKIAAEINDGNGTLVGVSNGLQGTTVLNDGKWHHLALVRSSTNVKLYVDGSQEASVTNSIIGNSLSSSYNLLIGVERTNGLYLNGKIDEVRIWNSARTQLQLQTNRFYNVSTSTSNLVAYYKCDAGSGTSLADATSNSNNGTFNGSVSWVASTANIASSDPGNALSFDGTNDYVSIPFNSSHNLSAGGTLTIEGWIKPAGDGNIIMKGNYGYGILISGSKLLYWDQGSQVNAISGSTTLTLNKWQHIAVTVQDIGSTLSINFYVNGVADAGNPYTSNQSSISDGGTNQILYLGRQGAGCNCNFYSGSLDELRIWNVVKTQSQLQSAMSSVLDPTSTGLVAYYRFDAANSGGTNTSATVLQDLSSNRNNGTLVNFSLSGSASNWVASAAIFPTFSTVSNTICSSQTPYTWNGVDYSVSGTYIKTFTGGNSKGYDSTATLNLSLVSSLQSITGASAVCAGSTTQLSNAVAGGVWSSISGRATVNAGGVVTGKSGGTATIKYAVAGCGSVTKTLAVNSLPSIPSIGYGVGSVNPQAGAGGGNNYCYNRTFTVIGSPIGGVWSKTGVLSVTNPGGVVSTGAVAGAGSLTYTYTSGAGCSSSRSISGNVVTCASRGIVDNSQWTMDYSQWTMYPNPAKSIVNINVETLVGKGSIVVTDLYGKTVKTQPLSMETNTVDIANLSKGMYFVSTITNEGKTTKKLVVE